ncbi:MAG: hypothetical protein ACETV1_07200 [Candidatus Bathyarchaeia archaeon]
MVSGTYRGDESFDSSAPWSGSLDSIFRGSLEDLSLRKLIRSLYSIKMVLSSLLEILFLSPEELEEMKKALREESIRQRAEYNFLSKYL